jgi:hypothetical protein
MDNSAAWSLMETVRQINEIGRRARSGKPGVEEYLRTVASDPTTAWFTELLREKTEELDAERKRADELACVLRAWYERKHTGPEQSFDEADLHLLKVLGAMKIINR